MSNNLSIIEKNYLKIYDTINVGDFLNITSIFIDRTKERKERIQKFEGLVIAIQNNSINKTFTLRRIVEGIGVEQIFFINSPNITFKKTQEFIKIRRSKLYYLRSFIKNLKGKSN
jgi:large subunit ribosomal protein L19